ncbi:SDR family NAD(P)-dependent oxidoreductase [Brasilonema sp. CT11]|nr:SDR family NAD(P)-dependent oxidoreductase [Brasilonema sp. CT11]
MSNDSYTNEYLSSSHRLLLALKEARKKLETVEAEKNEPIAIVGMGCRFPGANNLDEFWQLLKNGREAITEVPLSRWDINAYYHPDPKVPGKIYTRSGGFLDGIDCFDPLFFGISPREAIALDPSHRLLLEVSWEALENAAQIKPRLANSATGVFIGINANDYAELLKDSGEFNRQSSNTYDITGTPTYAAAGRLSYTLGLTGPSIAINTACSSSLVAVHLACQSLRNRECNMALAGGVNVILSPESTIALCRARMLAPDGRSKTFDAAADGMVRSEGCGIVVLKRLSDAVASKDNILGVILGSAINQDGPSSGFTVPNGSAQQSLIRQTLAMAKVKPSEVNYIEAHGTGTALGDPIEVNALGAVFAEGRSTHSPLLIGSVKTNIGHAEAAAGIAGLIKVVLGLQHQEIPPHLNFQQPNPHINWKQIPVEVTTQTTPWDSNQQKQIAGVNSFGASGTNAHIILAAAPELDSVKPEVDRPIHIVNLSAKTPTALAELTQRYIAHLDTHTHQNLADICYSANTGRAHLEYRLSIVADTVNELRRQLCDFGAGTEANPTLISGIVQEKTPQKIVFLFTGQGSQYVEMGKQLYLTQPTFRATLDAIAELFQPYLGVSLLEIIDSDREKLQQTVYAQPAIFALEYALYKLWQSWGIVPTAVMGHSVGEYVAACVAGVFSLVDAVQLIATRARLMHSIETAGKMVAVWATVELIESAIAQDAELLGIAAINGTENLVISGEASAIDRIVSNLNSQEIKTKPLSVSQAFHSPMMQPILADFRQVAEKISYFRPQLPLITNVSGTWAQAEIATPEYWVDHIRRPVQFARSLETLLQADYQIFLEIGSQPILIGMAQLSYPQTNLQWYASLKPQKADWQQMLETLAGLYINGIPVDWSGFDRDYPRYHLPLPTYPWQQQRYWLETTRKSQFFSVHNSGDRTVHPLLGSRLNLPLKEIVFTSQISTNYPTFLREHRIYEQVVFPATAYIEMALAAGSEILKTDDLLVESFSIQQALILPKAEFIKLHLVFTSDNQTYSFQIFSQSAESNDLDDWLLHATGKLQKISTSERRSTINISSWLTQPLEEISLTEYYQIFSKQEIDLGASFHALKKLGRSSDGVRGEVQLPDALIIEAGDYKLHPILLDACLQTLGAAFDNDSQKHTYLQVGLDRLKIYGSPGFRLYSQVKIHPIVDFNQPLRNADIDIFDPEGRLVVKIEGLQLMRTSHQALMMQIKEDWQNWIYQLDWRSQIRFTQAQLLPNYLLTPAEIGVQVELTKITIPNNLKAYQKALIELEALALEYLLDAFAKMGWLWQIGQQFSIAEIAQKLGIVNQHRRLLGRLLEMLSIAGVLQQQGDAWEVGQIPPQSNPKFLQQTLLQEYPIAETELAFLQRCGDKLAEVLQGQSDPLQLLFPNGDFSAATKFYQQSPGSMLMNTIAQKAIAIALEKLPSYRGVRILEIGAGTGGTTAYILPLLNPAQTKYVFTDVGAVFTSQAAQKFRDYPFVEYHVLDIEIDPQSQGLIPDQYDIIVAANVLHATMNLTETLQNVHQLLAPGGLLLLIEGSQPMGWIDLTFGLTEGWWKFTDLDVRPNYPLLSADRWIELLDKNGFEDTINIVSQLSDRQIMSQSAVIIARSESLPISNPQNWLIFSDATGVGDQLAAQLQDRGEKYNLVFPGTKYQQVTETAFQVDPANPADFERLLADISQKYGSLGGIIHCWSLDTANRQELTAVNIDKTLELGCGSILHLVQSLIKANFAQSPSLWLVTRGTQLVDRNQTNIAPTESTLWGLGKTIAMEHPEFSCRLIDLDPSADPAESSVLSAEILSPDLDSKEHLAIRQGQRYLLRLKQIEAIEAPPLQFSSDATYLIAGGLGGIGLAVASWMVVQGARYLVLIGRSSPDEEAKVTIQELEQVGATVVVAEADISVTEQLERILHQIQSSLPPLKGIIHSAGIFEDRLLRDHQWELFRKVFAPKVAGTWNLHTLTQNLPLDFFVLFSSGSSLVGASGLGNYVAANAFVDALAHYRHLQGLPGLSVNWGAWNKLGMAAAVGTQREAQWQTGGMNQMTSPQALKAFEYLLQHDLTQAGVISLDWSKFLAQLPQGVNAKFFEDFTSASETYLPQQSVTKFQKQLRKAPAGDRRQLLVAHVQAQVVHLMGLNVNQVPNLQQAFFDLGMDSLMSVELRNRLQNSLGCNLPSTLTFKYPTLGAVVDYLADEVLQLESLLLATSQTPVVTEQLPSCLIPLQPSGRQSPLFLLHPLAGVVFPYYELSCLLGENHPIYGLQSIGLEVNETPLTSIPEMARHYLGALRLVQPTGPYYLAGWSFGANLAFEIAQQLQQEGEFVAWLGLIDQPAPEIVKNSQFKMFANFWSSIVPRIWPYVYEYFYSLNSANNQQPISNSIDGKLTIWDYLLKPRQIVSSITRAIELMKSRQPAVSRLLRIIQINNQALLDYSPSRYSGQVSLFRTGDFTQDSSQDPTWGWGKLVEHQIDVDRIPGEHLNLLRQPHVSILAQKIKACLDRFH